MKKSLPLLSILMFVGVVGGSLAVAQNLALLPEKQCKYLTAEVSGDAAYEHIRFTTQFHKPGGGSEGLMAIARYVEAKAREYGLQDVRLIKQPDTGGGWNARRGELWLLEPDIRLLASMNQVQLHLADNSGSTDVTAEVVDVGSGTTEKDYAGKEVRGKIVLATGVLGTVVAEAVSKRGALGVIWYPPVTSSSLSNPERLRWISVPPESPGRPGTFAFGLSLRQGIAFRNLLSSAKVPVTVHATVESSVSPEKWQVMVEGFIRGTEINDQDVVMTAHMQEEKFSANDNGSGVASTLEIARALTKLINEGHLPRPRRNIRFWWTNEIRSERQYFADHPEDIKKLWVDVNQDMVGANQAQGIMRLQAASRLPFSRFHFLNDVAEAIVEYVVQSNTQYIAATQTGSRFDLYPKPILAHLGTSHRYNAAMVPYFSNTDHLTFNETPIGIPGITFTNWPDEYIHSSDDDLWNIDRTQLQRNAFAAGTIAYIMASAGEAQLPAIANEVYGRTTIRLAEDFKVATGLLTSAITADGRKDAYKQARNQLRQAVIREMRAINSLSVISPSAPGTVATLTTGVAKLEDNYAANLDSLYWSLGKTASSDARPQSQSIPVSLSAKEQELARVVPQVIAGPAEFLPKRNQTPIPSGLHRIMAWEALNFVNGERSVLDIYNAVSAEALRAGSMYYATVTPDDVMTYLQDLEKDGILKLRRLNIVAAEEQKPAKKRTKKD